MFVASKKINWSLWWNCKIIMLFCFTIFVTSIARNDNNNNRQQLLWVWTFLCCVNVTVFCFNFSPVYRTNSVLLYWFLLVLLHAFSNFEIGFMFILPFLYSVLFHFVLCTLFCFACTIYFVLTLIVLMTGRLPIACTTTSTQKHKKTKSLLLFFNISCLLLKYTNKNCHQLNRTRTQFIRTCVHC